MSIYNETISKPKGIPADTPRRSSTTRIPHVFHADLSDAYEGEDYWVQAMGKKYMLTPHTSETRAAARKAQPALHSVPDHQLTHFTAEAVPMPHHVVVRVHIRHSTRSIRHQVPYSTGMGNVLIYTPPPADYVHAADAAPVQYSTPIDYTSTAIALLFHNGDLISQDPTITGYVMQHMSPVDSPANYALIQQLAMQMRVMGPPAANSGWATLQPFDDGTGDQKYMTQPTDTIVNYAGPSTTAVMISTKNDTRLQGAKWTLQPGTSVSTAGVDTGDNNMQQLASISSRATGDNWTAAVANGNTVAGMQVGIEITDSTANQIQITVTNSYVRWLGIYLQFLDANGNAMSLPNWYPDDGGIVQYVVDAIGCEYDNFRFIGWVQPIDTVMAIPISADPGILQVKVTFPDGAVSANIYGCGIGTGSLQYPLAVLVGGVQTGLANLGIPTIFLGVGVAAQTYKPLYDIMGDKKFIAAVVAIGVAYFGTEFGVAAYNKQMDWHSFSSLLQILFTQAANKALLWVETQIVEGEIEDEIPFAGWIMTAINIATTLAQLSETIVEVCMSPWQIPNSISVTINSTVTVYPDPRHGAFPQPPAGSTASYVTKMIYQDNRPTLTTGSVNVSGTPATLSNQFVNTLGGQIKFEVDFYLNDWLAGKATTSWMDNNEDNTANVVLYLFEYPIPLNSSSVYQHTAMLTYADNAYEFTDTSSPCTATIANTDTSQNGNAISVWSGLTLSQRCGMLGLGWKAAGTGLTACSDGSSGQLYVFQNINIPGAAMDAVKFPTCGLTGPSQLVYDVYPPKFLMEGGTFKVVNGQPVPDPTDVGLGNYYIDPRKADNDPNTDGGYHLRKVVLDNSTPFNMGTDQLSWGRFPYYPDAITMHPSGNVIGVSQKFQKMMILQLPAQGQNDSDLPLALSFAGQALNYDGSNGRAGLLFTPIGITCSYDGTIFVLEQLVSQDLNIARVQAFDLNGNPVSCFTDTMGQQSPFLTLPATVTYLDVAAVGDNKTTYIYVISYANTGQNASDYTMSLYQTGSSAPAGNFLVSTPNIPAAKINVDMWNTLYTLNYAMTTNGDGANSGPDQGQPNVGPAGRTVPSVSEWLPPLPS